MVTFCANRANLFVFFPVFLSAVKLGNVAGSRGKQPPPKRLPSTSDTPDESLVRLLPPLQSDAIKLEKVVKELADLHESVAWLFEELA